MNLPAGSTRISGQLAQSRIVRPYAGVEPASPIPSRNSISRRAANTLASFGRRHVGNHLNFDDPAGAEQAGRSHRRPRGMGTMHEFFLDLIEGFELLFLGAGKVGAAPHMEAVDHENIVEARTRGSQLMLYPPECSAGFVLERLHVGTFARAARNDNA